MTTPHAAAFVDDEHVLVAANVVNPVVVTFDGQYVWSFAPERDGALTGEGRRVDWPETMRTRLDGTAHVRVHDSISEAVYFDAPVAFRGNAEPFALRDTHGHPLSVDKSGHLTRVFSETGSDIRRHIAEGTARAIADLRDSVGIDAHVSYGCLLGAVREGRMIGHDSDSDLAYLSAYTHPTDIVRESYRMEREMRALDWKVVRMSGADLKLFLPLPDGRSVHVDVFGAFHVGSTFYQLGGRSGHLPREALTPVSTVMLEGVELAAPADPEKVLEFLYGPGWRVPDPSFQPEDPEPGVRRLDGWLRGPRRHVTEWNELFRDRRADIPRTKSTFAVWAVRRMPKDATVVDLGTGNGRDTVWFTRRRLHVIAFDYAGTPVRQTRRRLAKLDQGSDVRMLVLNDLRTALLAGAELSREAVPPYLYGRELVGCLDAEARSNLWRLCSMSLRHGGALFLEYAAARDGLAGTTVEGLVTRVHTDDLVAEIEAAGGQVVHREEGPGLGFFDEVDPLVARLEIRWHHDPTTSTPHRSGAPMSTEDAQRPRGFIRTAIEMPTLVRELRESVQENRRLNRRVAELTDVVTELLVPLAEGDAGKARELLEAYRRSTLAP